jgi:ribosomal protein S17E
MTMASTKKFLKTIRESAEADLPTSASDAASEVADSLAGKVGARAVKKEVDGEKIAADSGTAKKVAAEAAEDDEKKDAVTEDADSDLPVQSSDAKSTIPEEEDSEKKAVAEADASDDVESDKAVTEEEEEDSEKKAVAESDDADEDDIKLSEEEEEKLASDEDADVKEAADALTKDENLPESFKEKVAAIFEAAVKRTAKRRAEAHAAKLAEAYSKKLATKKKTISETLVNKVDGYLDYVVEEWMKENEVAIESSLRSNITEKFIVGLKGLFESHYIEVPADKTDVIAQQEKKIVALEKELNEELVKSVELRKENTTLKKANIIKKHTEGLTVSDASKFVELCQGVSFENAKTFSQKLQVIKETYFLKTPSKSGDLDASLLTEGGLEHTENVTPSGVDIYAQTISRMVKR